MKGIIFDEFCQLVESQFGDEVLDEIIEENIDKLPSRGSYTVVGTYDYNELLTMVTALATKSGIDVSELVKAFGLHLSSAFSKRYPEFFESCENSFDFVKTIDSHIHVEVHKLYPDAQLPSFSYEQKSDNQMILEYRSHYDFSQLAYGLLEGAARYYGEELAITSHHQPTDNGAFVIFDIQRV
jgi:hypothetical protein